jgi:hypothetical protein
VCAALEVDMLNVGSGIDNVHINTLSRISGIKILVVVAERQAISVGNTSETPWGVLLKLPGIS